MNDRRKKGLIQIIVGTAVLLVTILLYAYGPNGKAPISNFNECVAAGYPVMESYPRQCRTKEGETFREDIGNELEKDNLIRISEPRPNTTIESPLTITGMARGNWFFEASFPVRLLDGNGERISEGIATAEGDWMTSEFVPFKASLTFTRPSSNSGTLVLEKDNPSGLPEQADELRIPVLFSSSASSTPPVAKACVISGCSSHICADEEMITTCEFKEEYACYKQAKCERQKSGACGWTETATLRACIDKARESILSLRNDTER